MWKHNLQMDWISLFGEKWKDMVFTSKNKDNIIAAKQMI